MGVTLNLTDDEAFLIEHLIENELIREADAEEHGGLDEEYVDKLKTILEKL